MTTITNYEHAWRYARQNGFCAKRGFPGWIPQAQRDMATIEHLIDRMSGGYPCEVITKMYRDGTLCYPWLSTIFVRGAHGALFCNLRTWRNPGPENTDKAHIQYCTVFTPEDCEGDYSHEHGLPWNPVLKYDREGESDQFWPDEAERFMNNYVKKFEKLNQDWHVNTWESQLGAELIAPDFSLSVCIQIETQDWEG